MWFSSVNTQSAINAFISPRWLNLLMVTQKLITVSFLCVQTYMQWTDERTEKQKKGNVFGLLSWRLSLHNLTSIIQLPDCQLVLLTLSGREKGMCTNCQMFLSQKAFRLAAFSKKVLFFSNADAGFSLM